MTTRYSIAQNVHWQHKNDRVFLLPYGSDEMIELNETGSFVWQKLQKPQTVETIINQVAEHFSLEVSAVEHDIKQFLQLLHQEKLLSTSRG